MILEMIFSREALDNILYIFGYMREKEEEERNDYLIKTGVIVPYNNSMYSVEAEKLLELVKKYGCDCPCDVYSKFHEIVFKEEKGEYVKELLPLLEDYDCLTDCYDCMSRDEYIAPFHIIFERLSSNSKICGNKSVAFIRKG